ncbi:MAG: long-chain fatty acid--CoA ligase [Thermodesulfobacteriota bacterium]|nr:long-chain fatty acid--CoA ligase [Thermodesulfobacteriota bacterium]
MNLGEWIYKRALTYPDRPFLKCGNLEYNNRQFNEKVNQMAHALIKLGVKKGDRVATLMGNSSEFLEIFFACAKTGMIILPLNFRLVVPELEYIISDCTPSVLIYSSDFVTKVEEIKADQDKIKHYLKHRGDELADDLSVVEFASSCPAEEPVLKEEIAFKDPLLIMYTSGTTGGPKGAMLSHENFFFGAIHSMISYGINATYKSLVIAPLFHIGALAASATPIIYAGGSLVIESFDNPSEISDLIFKEKINYIFAVPVMYEMIAKTPRWEKVDFSHVHFFIAGGASMPVPLIRKYQKEKGIRFAQAYAMTETLRLTTLDLEDSARKAGSVGKEVFHILLRIVDNDGNDVLPGEPGEIIVKGPTIFLQYWNKPEETRKAFQNGWFHTGDMGKRDEEGFLYIVGRKIDLIISSGENIYSVEVERAIESIPQVEEAAAVAMPDPKRGEVVAGFVLLKKGAGINETGLIEALQGKIAHFKIPKKVFFIKDFPRNSAGKILKRELRARLNPSR